MLKIDIRFNNGILFLKLYGNIDEKGSVEFDSQITRLIIDNGIKYVYLNLKDVKYICPRGIEIIKQNYKNIIINKGKLIVSGIQGSLKNVKLSNYLYELEDERRINEVINI